MLIFAKNFNLAFALYVVNAREENLTAKTTAKIAVIIW
jgi:hypothetical protein